MFSREPTSRWWRCTSVSQVRMNSFSIGHAPGLFFARAAIDGAHQRVMPTLEHLGGVADNVTRLSCSGIRLSPSQGTGLVQVTTASAVHLPWSKECCGMKR